MSYLERPGYYTDILYETVGYPTRIGIDQEDDWDMLEFRLHVYASKIRNIEITRECRCIVHLDIGTIVAVAQLGLIRDAMREPGRFCLRIHFTFEGDFDDGGRVFVYMVELIAVHDGATETVADYYDPAVYDLYGGTPAWFAHKREP